MEHTERKRNMTDGIETARRLIADEREKKSGFLDLGNLRLTEVPVELFRAHPPALTKPGYLVCGRIWEIPGIGQ